jgi:lipoprotein signal peptidase
MKPAKKVGASKASSIQQFDNILELMHFFNRVAGFCLFNDKSTFLLYLAMMCGSDIT